MKRVNPVSGLALAGWLISALPGGAEQSGLRLGFVTPDGQTLSALQRGLFDAFFEGQLSYDAYLDDIGDPTGPFAGNGLGIVLERGLSGPLGLHYRLSLEAGQSRAHFPDGIDIFRDPATITVRYVSTRAGVDLLHAWPLLERPALEATVTAGLAVTHARAHLRSALLDVRSTVTQTDPWLRLEVEATPLAKAPDLKTHLALTAYPQGRAYLGFGTRLSF